MKNNNKVRQQILALNISECAEIKTMREEMMPITITVPKYTGSNDFLEIVQKIVKITMLHF